MTRRCSAVLSMCGYDRSKPNDYTGKPNVTWEERCRWEAHGGLLHSVDDAHWGTFPFFASALRHMDYVMGKWRPPANRS